MCGLDEIQSIGLVTRSYQYVCNEDRNKEMKVYYETTQPFHLHIERGRLTAMRTELGNDPVPLPFVVAKPFKLKTETNDECCLARLSCHPHKQMY